MPTIHDRDADDPEAHQGKHEHEWPHGFGPLGCLQVPEAAGVSQMPFFRYLPTKEAMIIDLRAANR